MLSFFPMSPDPYIRFGPDQELAKFGHLNAIVRALTAIFAVNPGLTAHAGGGQALGTPLIAGYNSFAIVATAADSGTLPSLVALNNCTPCGPIPYTVVNNKGVASADVYAFPGEYVNGTLNGFVAVPAGAAVTFVPITNNSWESLVG